MPRPFPTEVWVAFRKLPTNERGFSASPGSDLVRIARSPVTDASEQLDFVHVEIERRRGIPGCRGLILERRRSALSDWVHRLESLVGLAEAPGRGSCAYEWDEFSSPVFSEQLSWYRFGNGE